MADARAFARLADWILERDGFTLVAHVSPDGDTLGSSLALLLALDALGKRAEVVCDQPVPPVYAFLPGTERVQSTASGTCPNLITIDCADARRMGAAQSLLRSAEGTAVLDHHESNAGFGALNLIDPSAAATGELVFALIETLSLPLTREIATCLFVAINTDTGNFAYSNTTPESFRIAAKLLETGISIDGINRLLYRTVPYGKTKLLGLVLSRMERHSAGRIGFSYILMEDYAACGATGADVEGIIDSIRDVASVEIAILVRAARDETYKVSLRSKEYADVAALAASLGGGGHKRAAGCTIPLCPIEALRTRLLTAAKAALIDA